MAIDIKQDLIRVDINIFPNFLSTSHLLDSFPNFFDFYRVILGIGALGSISENTTLGKLFIVKKTCYRKYAINLSRNPYLLVHQLGTFNAIVWK